MNKNYIIVLCLLSVVFSCKNASKLILENSTSIQRTDEAIVLARDFIESRYGKINNGEIIVFNSDSLIVPCQFDDLDNDGIWDEMILMCSFNPREEKVLRPQVINWNELPRFEKRTNIRMGRFIDNGKEVEDILFAKRLSNVPPDQTYKYFQFEGPGWENDKVGFRNYFDARNGMDIFGKTTTKMVMDSIVGLVGYYHEIDWWGMDILKVGNSLGAGSLAIQYRDSLYRVTTDKNATFQLISEGPLRSVFKLTFDSLSIEENTIEVEHYITIYAGKYGYESSVKVKGLDNYYLVTGIVNMHSDSLYHEETDNYICAYTFDKQAYNNEFLGMALIAERPDFVTFFESSETSNQITETYCVKLKNSSNKFNFEFYAGWEISDTVFAKIEGFSDYMKSELLKKNNPVIKK
ncbi:MAG: DUF4861 family protein [Bacteroidales bacterium]|nr:DUF4861 family protein [Bacteroidales bacterium]